jgi:hypothetical protein
MTDQPPASIARPVGPHAAREIGIAAVFLGVAALAAVTFVLSYPAIQAFAHQAGLSTRLARAYPLLVDVMLVVAAAAILSLRGSGLPGRLLAWLTFILLLVAAGGVDTMHATGHRLPAKVVDVVAAALPWLLILVAFGLLLAMLRQARLRRLDAVSDPAPAPRAWDLSIIPGLGAATDPVEPHPVPVVSGNVIGTGDAGPLPQAADGVAAEQTPTEG